VQLSRNWAANPSLSDAGVSVELPGRKSEETLPTWPRSGKTRVEPGNKVGRRRKDTEAASICVQAMAHPAEENVDNDVPYA